MPYLEMKPYHIITTVKVQISQSISTVCFCPVQCDNCERSIFLTHLRMSKLSVTFITKTRLYNFDPLKPYFYIHVVKLGFTGVYSIFLISAQNELLYNASK